MPIYEFECRPCKERFELLIGFSRLDEAKCPKCGSGKVQRMMSTFAAHTSGGSSHDHHHGSGGCANCASGNCGSCKH
jgi:putative FmdB family regulatory protein